MDTKINFYQIRRQTKHRKGFNAIQNSKCLYWQVSWPHPFLGRFHKQTGIYIDTWIHLDVPLDVSVKNFNRQTIILEVSKKERETITSLRIKELVLAKEDIPIEEQNIVSCGKEWKDDMTESDIRKAHLQMRDIGLSEPLNLIRKAPIPEHLRSIIQKITLSKEKRCQHI